MVKYTVAMTIRVVCIVMLLFVQGWWLVVFAAGAIFLPYIAVVLANVQSAPAKQGPERPSRLAIGGSAPVQSTEPYVPSDDNPPYVPRSPAEPDGPARWHRDGENER